MKCFFILWHYLNITFAAHTEISLAMCIQQQKGWILLVHEIKVDTLAIL